MDEAIEFARRIEWRSGVSRARIWVGLALGPRGAYVRAFEHAREGLRIALDDGQIRYAATAHILLGALHLDLGAPEAARDDLDEALALATAAGSSTVVATAASFRAQAALELGEVDGALALLDASDSQDAETMPARLLGAARAEVEIARGNPDEALAIVDRLVRCAPGRDEATVVPRLEHLRGAALARAGRHAEACAILDEAAQAAAALGQRGLHWRILASHAGAAWLHGRVAEAESIAARARAAIESLAQEVPAGDAREAFVRAAVARVPRPRRRRRARAPDELTKREREIVSLIVAGLPNRGIAKQLHISERTVERHVENVLAKLGFSSRVQVAVWAAARPHEG